MNEVLEGRLFPSHAASLTTKFLPDFADVRGFTGAELGGILARRKKVGLLGFAHEDFTETGIRLPGNGPTGEIP